MHIYIILIIKCKVNFCQAGVENLYMKNIQNSFLAEQ